MTLDINNFTPQTGRVVREDGSVANFADILTAGFICSGSVSWTANESTSKTFDIVLPGIAAAGQQFLVSIKNPSTVDLSVSVNNMINFTGTAEACELVASTDFTVAAGTAKSKIVQGILLAGTTTRLTLSKASATAAEFTANIEIRRC